MREESYSLAPPEAMNQPKVWLIAPLCFVIIFLQVDIVA